MVLNYKSDKKELKKGLYLVATPIGNLEDITHRAINILSKSEFILCEDTRVSKKLLDKYGIQSKLISNHKFNEKKNLTKIIQLLKSDAIISLISDAGTPAVSDPGSILVRECVDNNINVIPVPGPSAVSTAVSISGFSDRFYFHGFLADKLTALNKELDILSNFDFSIVFFVSAKKINKFIPHLKNFFSDRKILICKELTKMYEQHFRFNVSEIDDFNTDLRGEITLVLSEKLGSESNTKLSEKDKLIIRKLMKKLSIKDVVTEIKNNKDISKKEIYNYCLQVKNEK
jgi:16S rRNA (cytidine1402-2'-O)-methyltransferase